MENVINEFKITKDFTLNINGGKYKVYEGDSMFIEKIKGKYYFIANHGHELIQGDVNNIKKQFLNNGYYIELNIL